MNETLLDDLIPEDIRLVEASKPKRFANYIIDALSFYIIIIFISMVYYIFLDASYEEAPLDEDTFEGLWFNILSMIFYALYYFFAEALLNGKTIGKYITRTRAVDIDGSGPDTVALLKRSFSRIVPFEGFSYLGDSSSGWHDQWSHTMVIDERKSNY